MEARAAVAAPSPPAGALAVFAAVSRLHIVAIAALGTLTFGWLFTGRYLLGLSAVAALDWFLVNLTNRLVDLREDAENGIVGTDFVARHRTPLLIGSLGLLGGSLVALHLARPELTALRLAFHALGLAYNWPLLPGGRRIKQLYFWKNTASAGGFLITVFGFPLASAGWGRGALPAGVTPATLVTSAAFFFLFELSYEVVYDLRDARGDAAEGVRTYPVVHGEAGAVRIVDGLLLGSVVVLVGGYAAGLVPWRIVVMALAPALQAVLYKRALRRGITSADCVRITWLGAGLLAAYHGWVLAGLPGV